ncbi:MAG: gamma carbonic anhydrase family protein [Verrucomicrobiales bacterium]|jgi:carbonic anhydrase/acetyltransferase-like protein (isoleucine patch superfamily)|nr:gamma carbonic anhydrase family protein [Verrucomicrobiales bacterium]|tara:strand:- start:10683 stop:11234 length:552 start_codon:yes stop_codon:yes gene_type:complete
MSSETICTHLRNQTNIHTTAFVAPGADVLGNVTLEEFSSVWYGCILRGDIEAIQVGKGSNIQDGTVIHLASDLGTRVGEYVTVGHRALLHACEVEDEVLIGMGAIVMDGARIGARSIVAAGTVVTRGVEVPPGSLVVGTPGKIVKSLSINEQKGIKEWAEKYIKVSAEHRAFLAEQDRAPIPE